MLWYYQSTVLDDYSRYILWTLTTTMQATDVMTTLDLARAKAGVDQVHVVHQPRLLSDNGPCYVSQALGRYLTQHGLTHTRRAPYHPMTQGKIEWYHRSMKNVVKLDVYHSPCKLERAIGRFVEHYNHRRLHESLQNVTPADVYEGRQRDDLGPSRANQTGNARAAGASEPAGGMMITTCRECDLLSNRNGPENSDDVHPRSRGRARSGPQRPG